MDFTQLLEWWNFIFALPLVVGMILSAGMLFSAVSEGSSDAEGDSADADADHADSADAHTHTDTTDSVHTDSADVAHSDSAEMVKAHHAHHHDDPTALVGKALKIFGIGMGVPLTVLLPVLFIFWGAIGLTTNALLQPLLKVPALFVPISVVASLVGMALMGRTTGLLVRRFGLLGEGRTPTRYDLIGCTGHAVFPIDSEQGVANIRARSGDIVRISCRTLPGQPPISSGTAILVVQYNQQTNEYIVEPNPFEVDLSDPAQQENLDTERNYLRG